MANINTQIQKIMDAVYGEEVRGAIRDSLIAMNEESSDAIRLASTAKDSAAQSASEAKLSAQTAARCVDEANASASSAKASEDRALEAASEASKAQSLANLARDGAVIAKESAESNAAAAQTSRLASEEAQRLSEQYRDSAKDDAAKAAANAKMAEQYSGKPPKIQNETWWIWDAETGDYVDTHMTSKIPGPQGVGVDDIVLTSGDHSPGTADIYAVNLTDGSHYTISVWNGRNGEGTGDVLGISFDLVIPYNAWTEGSATVADERLVASGMYKYFMDSDPSCEDKYYGCAVRAKNVTNSGFVTFVSDTVPETDLTVNVLRLELGANKS